MMTTKEVVNTYRTTAKTVGIIYLLGMVVGITGNILILSILNAPDSLSAISANSMMLAFGVLLWLGAVAGDAAHGILMFPILKPHGERIAIGYLAFRILDAAFVAVMALLILAQIPLGREYLIAGASDTPALQALSAVLTQTQLYGYHFGMLTVGIAGLMLCYVFYKAKLLPRWLAIWGLVGYAIILFGSGLEVLGFNLQTIQTIPGGLWEVFIGVWLIVKGFNAPVIASKSAKTQTAEVLSSA